MFLYNLVDNFLMNDFTDEVIKNINKDNPVIFDVGCFIGNYSRKLKKKLNYKNLNFYLFDANPNLKIKDFKYINEVFSNKIETKNFYLKKYSASYGADKIYISRRKSSRRKLKNEDELIKILLNNNFKVLDMEDFDFKKQVQISAKSKIMISTHGAGLTNLMWMKKQSSIIEIRDYKDDTLNPYFAMCGCLNIKYYCYFAKKNNLSNFTSHYDYEIDIKNFIKRFKKIICKN